MAALALLNMRGWLAGDLLPPYDFAGYASAVEDVRNEVLRFGRVPEWSSRWFGGSARFTSSLKELATLPLALCLDSMRAVQAMTLILKVLAGLAMYGLLVRLFSSPAVGMVAGYAYAFSTPANYDMSVHLHIAVSYVLFPLIFCATAELLSRGRRVWAAALGVLVACQFSNNYVLVLICLATVILLILLRPWRRVPDESNFLEDRQLAFRWCGLLGMALFVFGIFSASQLAWLFADLHNHALHSREEVGWGLEVYIEHSPFVYFNRGNWLGPWLASHHPPAMPLFPEEPLRNQRHYLGIVAMAVCATGWFAARQHHSLRRWYQTFGLLFLLQYWLSTGPSTLLSQIARTFHWPPSMDEPLRIVLTAASIGWLAWALVLYLRRQRQPEPSRTHRIEFALGLTLLFCLSSHSLFEVASTLIPPLRGMRAPGRFFELAPFAFFALFGVGLVAIERRLPGLRWRRIVLLSTAALVVVDFWPSGAAFFRGTAVGPVREFRKIVANLPSDGGTLRIGLFPWRSAVRESLVSVASEAGVGWSWLPWQAGKYWKAYYRGAMLWLADEFDAEERESYRPLSEALGRIGRLKYFLGDPQQEPGEPWHLRAANEAFALWEHPRVVPKAQGYHSYALFVGKNPLTEALSLYRASQQGLLLLSGGKRFSQSSPALMDGAAVVFWEPEEARTDDRSRVVADRHAGKLARAEITDLLGGGSPLAVPGGKQERFVGVRYARLSPTRIVLDTEAGGEAEVVFVSEAYHPWWRATVDGQPIRVLRANMAFMAVEVSPGAHTIDMRFNRPLLVQGADWITALSWVVLGLTTPIWMVVRLGRRRG